ncbi:hypothetical protein A3C91_00125 [Candidatus Azambacteria bacterium RIFCSPHIGHO2_02_FULL_52_12]|uniref:Uncharacterized protein n=1 Tax=Candidatus Azambacteria bacterium RIFCSPLOWO2_01_FULL_46_25 TaxID=1797298 RepID=A0A1F5BUM1_9BACT|nr:MAG: hypothetical protein A3C91_00125 [Candidatus Azambacteria bacterium RIFCSPHIGHO2_02_FULL_52_12]OGD34325.1 MAG: hypothetical protein A2988_02235 [Candidatus Azambacteria bacterium RIFCSPLOWO2_01_FULL_46_25]OGD37843.1 MAG: hypothetical protein A2850_03030 [Candidatus Azambacteria bacterium RIFCSPHIGHO2_01_FULL_51_74]
MTIKEHLPHVTKRGFLLALRSFGIALTCVILLVFIGGRIHANVTEITKARNEIAAFSAKYEQFDQLKKDRETVQSSLGKLENAIPTADNVTIVVDYINSLGIQTGNIVVARFDSNTRANEGAFDEIGFSLSVNGTLPSVLNLLSQIESAPYLIAVKTVSLAAEASLSRQLAAQLSGVAYLQNEQNK